MDWATLVSQIGVYCQQTPPNDNPEFTSSIATFIQNAEQRIYREVDLVSTREQVYAISFTAGSRTLNLALLGNISAALLTDTGSPILTDTGIPILTTNAAVISGLPYPMVVQGISAIIPSPIVPSLGRRQRFRVASLDWIDNIWPNEATTAVPTPDNAYFAMLSDTIAVVAPTPPAAYVAEITGTWRPTQLSATNTETWLSTVLPDLLFCACMIEATAWQQDFGEQSDNPQMAMSWARRYSEAKASALEEDQRRKSAGPGWQPFAPTPNAQPPR